MLVLLQQSPICTGAYCKRFTHEKYVADYESYQVVASAPEI